MKIRTLVVFVALFLTSGASHLRATGISIDAGLTPAQGKWILRSQVRYMERANDPSPMSRQMKAYMFPVVVAYGVQPNLTVMARQLMRRMEMSMGNARSSQTGFGDLLLMTKYRLLRVNRPGYVIGIAPTIGLEIPLGENSLSSQTWDLRLGWFVSGRVHTWSFDLNLAYVWNGMAKTDGSNLDPGDELVIEAALGRQFGFGGDAVYSLAPVLELSYAKTTSDALGSATVANTGESVFQLSPGLKLTRSSFVLEGLVQFPVWQDQEGMQLERATGFLVGIRLMY